MTYYKEEDHLPADARPLVQWLKVHCSLIGYRLGFAHGLAQAVSTPPDIAGDVLRIPDSIFFATVFAQAGFDVELDSSDHLREGLLAALRVSTEIDELTGPSKPPKKREK